MARPVCKSPAPVSTLPIAVSLSASVVLKPRSSGSYSLAGRSAILLRYLLLAFPIHQAFLYLMGHPLLTVIG